MDQPLDEWFISLLLYSSQSISNHPSFLIYRLFSFPEVVAQFEEQLCHSMTGYKAINIATSLWSILQSTYGQK